MRAATWTQVALLAGVVACVQVGPHGSGAIEEAPQDLRLYVLDGGSTQLPKIAFGEWYAGQGMIEIPVTCYLIVHPLGTLLWDTGHEAGAAQAEPDPESPYRVTVGADLATQLGDVGLSVGDVDYLALSHFHFDHTGNANLFAHASQIGQVEEFDMAFGPDAEEQFGVHPHTYCALASSDRIELVGDHDVFGDGSVVVLRAPGHTPGSQALLVDLPNNGPVLLSGDLYHFEEQWRHRRVPPFNHSAEETVASMQRIQSIVDVTGADLWITHDPVQMEAKKSAQPYYD